MVHRTLTVVAVLMLGATSSAQPPQWNPQNLQHFPKDISQEQLTQRMREFSFALGVRCEYCHDVPAGAPPTPAGMSSDARPAKLKARAMLKMVDTLNAAMLPALPSRVEPRVEVTCATCHRGLPIPKSLQTTLFEIVKRDGAAAAVARYRELRARDPLSGRYNFGEWEVNELARRLVESGDRPAAIAILEMNGEFYPKSPSIDFQLGELHLAGGDRDKALRHFTRTLEKAPEHQGAKQRLAEIDKR